MSPILLREAIARLINSKATHRPLICYGYPQALAETSSACSSLALTMEMNYREVRAPLADAPWSPGEMTLALVDCSVLAPELSIDRWIRWLSRFDADSESKTLALFFRADKLDAADKEQVASLAFHSVVPCVFVSSAPTLCELFSALRSELPPRALAQVDFSSPEGSEAWDDLSRMGAALDAVENRWAAPLQNHVAYIANPQLVTVTGASGPTHRLAAFFERLGL